MFESAYIVLPCVHATSDILICVTNKLLLNAQCRARFPGLRVFHNSPSSAKDYLLGGANPGGGGPPWGAAKPGGGNCCPPGKPGGKPPGGKPGGPITHVSMSINRIIDSTYLLFHQTVEHLENQQKQEEHRRHQQQVPGIR